MVLFPRSGFGRFLLGLIILSTISYLVLNLVSFGGTSWITYTDAPIRFGLWRVCDTSASGLCNQWADDTYSSNITLFVFGSSKPGFIRTSQALEIISLIFYVVAAVLIIAGILNLGGLSYYIMFGIAAVLLLICIAFLSATVGVMSVQGRSGHPGAYLDWAWWNGLVGLIMTIVCFFALLFLILDMRFSSTNKAASSKQNAGRQQNLWSGVPPGPYGMTAGAPPVVALNQMVYPPPTQAHYDHNQYSQGYPSNNTSYSAPHHYDYNHYDQQQQQQYQQQQQQQYAGNPYPNNSMMDYGSQAGAEQYYHDQTPSPIIAALARQYVFDIGDAQYANQLLHAHGYSNQAPYVINDYL